MQDDGTQLFSDLMRFLPEGMTANGWAVRAGVSRTVWADLKRHGNPSRRTMEKLLQAVDSSLAEFEALRIGGAAPALAASSVMLKDQAQGWRAASLPPLPLFETIAAGEWGDPGSAVEMLQISRDAVIGHIARPVSVAADRDAYAVTIPGESMRPRFRPGGRVAVSPLAPIGEGDDVLVMLRGPSGQAGPALVKELVRQTGRVLLLRQHHPSIEFEIPADQVVTMHRVLGELI